MHNIPHFIVISLSYANERRNSVGNEFSKLNIPFEFFDAYDKEKTISYLKAKGKQIPVKNKSWWARLGCKISHIESIKYAKSKGFTKVFILEDDITFRPNFANTINKYIELLPSDNFITLFGYYIKDKEFVLNQNVSYKVNDSIYTVTETHGAHCILYNLESPYYNIYINSVDALKKDEHYDLEMHKICNYHNIPRYAVYPQYTAQANGFSFINEKEKNWDLSSEDVRYDLLKSGTVYDVKFNMIRSKTVLSNGLYYILYKGKEILTEYKNGYFIIDNKPNNSIIYYRKYE